MTEDVLTGCRDTEQSKDVSTLDTKLREVAHAAKYTTATGTMISLGSC